MPASHVPPQLPIEPEPDDAAEDLVELVVEQEHAGQRLDRFLTSQLTDLSRTRIQNLIDQGRVAVDDISVKPSHRVEAGQTITLEIPPPPIADVAAEPLPLELLYEDEDVAVINKPAGMIVHPGVQAETGTLVGALLHRFGVDGLSNVGGSRRFGIVHRLDKDTSGAIVIARNNDAHRKLVEEFQSRQVEKIYVALLHGAIKGDSGTVDLPIARDLKRRTRMTARRRDGREARTDWRVKLRLTAFSLVQADIHTGRTHQIRVHFSTIGCPVVGDSVYGAPRQERVSASVLLPPLRRNFLHAARLAFTHPRTGERIAVKAPLPSELVDYLRTLGQATQTGPVAIDAAMREFL